MKFYTITTATYKGKGHTLITELEAKNRKEAMIILDKKLFNLDTLWIEVVGKKEYEIDGYSGAYKKSELRKLRREMKQILKDEKKTVYLYVGQLSVVKKLKDNRLALTIKHSKGDKLSAHELADELIGKGKIWDYYSADGAKTLCKLIKAKVGVEDTKRLR